MSELKPYFISRVGKRLVHTADGFRPGAPPRREYGVTVRGVDGAELLASVVWVDLDREGRKLTPTRSDEKVVRVALRGLDGAAEALEDAARAADPDFFRGRPAPERGTGAADGQLLDRRIADLAAPEGRGKGEAPPTPASVARLRAFWAASPGLTVPDLFSSEDGTLRARWMNGADRTLWIKFPARDPLAWTASVPRDGAYGLRKINARCMDDQDVIPVAQLLGIRCTR